jgi:hypothetical protein
MHMLGALAAVAAEGEGGWVRGLASSAGDRCLGCWVGAIQAIDAGSRGRNQRAQGKGHGGGLGGLRTRDPVAHSGAWALCDRRSVPYCAGSTSSTSSTSTTLQRLLVLLFHYIYELIRAWALDGALLCWFDHFV